MAFKTGARIRETSTTAGTGTYTLDGAPTGFQAFSTLGANATCPYFATDGTNWEEGIGTVLTGPNRLERTTILESSNADAAVDWGVGTRTLRCGPISSFGIPRVLSKSVAGGAGTTILTASEQRRDHLLFTGALTGNRVVEVDATPWRWTVLNSCTGSFSLTFKVTGQTGLVIPPKGTVYPYIDAYDVYCDGVDTFFIASGLPIPDSNPIVRGSTDSTKQLRFEVDGFTAATTNVITVPDTSGTMALTTGLQTFTGKTFDMTDNILTGTYTEFVAAVSDEDPIFTNTTQTLTNKTINADSNTITNIDQGNLKTGSGEATTTNSSAVHSTAPGGQYGFWPNVNTDLATSLHHSGITTGWSSATSYTAIWHIWNSSGAGALSRIRQLYISASPPYDLGDGEVPLFIFAVIDSLGKVESTWTAEDPPWANNGPTDIHVDYFDEQGRGWQRRKRRPNMAALKNPELRDEELARLVPEPDLIEVTQAVKHADMPLIPHPFVFGNDLTGKTVVLLDPVGQVTERLRRIHRGGESAADLLHDGYITVGNSPIARAGPPGVMPVAVSWKLTP
jgi:hypothetical protein